MNERLALLQAIIENSADDTVRLAFADWLDELPTKTVTCTRCKGRGCYSFRSAEFGYEVEDCEECGKTGTVTDTTNRDRAAYIRESLAGTQKGVPQNMDELLPRLELYWYRGFVEEVICTPANFAEHADSLIWHPTQTVACPTCDGRSVQWQLHTYCPECGKANRGRVPRPCPETAQPITRVYLTQRVGHEQKTVVGGLYGILGRPLRHNFGTRRDVSAIEVLEAEWPGVKFSMPLPAMIRAGQWLKALPDGRVVPIEGVADEVIVGRVIDGTW